MRSRHKSFEAAIAALRRGDNKVSRQEVKVWFVLRPRQHDKGYNDERTQVHQRTVFPGGRPSKY